MAEAAHPVFISYARLDQPLVLRAVEFLRAGGLNVFVDSQSIAYGTDWREALTDAIENAERVMLFWTAAASLSRWVTREWKLALKRGKKVVPTLLDDTPLPPRLARLHAVTSLRGLFPAPARRQEELIQQLVQAGDYPNTGASVDDDDVEPVDAMDHTVVAPARARAAAPAPARSSAWRLGLIASSLAMVGLASWLVLKSPLVIEGPAPSSMPASGIPYPGSTAPAPPVSAVSSAGHGASAAGAPAPGETAPRETPAGPAPSASAVTPSPELPPSSEPSAMIESPSWLVPVIALVLATAGMVAVRRHSKRGRARSIVRELYAA